MSAPCGITSESAVSRSERELSTRMRSILESFQAERKQYLGEWKTAQYQVQTNSIWNSLMKLHYALPILLSKSLESRLMKLGQLIGAEASILTRNGFSTVEEFETARSTIRSKAIDNAAFNSNESNNDLDSIRSEWNLELRNLDQELQSATPQLVKGDKPDESAMKLELRQMKGSTTEYTSLQHIFQHPLSKFSSDTSSSASHASSAQTSPPGPLFHLVFLRHFG